MRSFKVILEYEGTEFAGFQYQVGQRTVQDEVEKAIRGSEQFNHRQLALLSAAIRNPTQSYSFRSHATSHNVTEETARTDLLRLWKLNLVVRKKTGRRYVFEPAADLSERLMGKVAATAPAGRPTSPTCCPAGTACAPGCPPPSRTTLKALCFAHSDLNLKEHIAPVHWN